MRPQSFLAKPALLVCKSISRVEGESIKKNNDHWTLDEGLFILKTIIIGHGMKLFILMPGGSGLPSPDTTASKGYVTRILRSCVRGMSNPITPITRILLASERSRRWKKREKQKLAPYKIYSLHHS
jgi:hypothetical protein